MSGPWMWQGPAALWLGVEQVPAPNTPGGTGLVLGVGREAGVPGCRETEVHVLAPALGSLLGVPSKAQRLGALSSLGRSSGPGPGACQAARAQGPSGEPWL